MSRGFGRVQREVLARLDVERWVTIRELAGAGATRARVESGTPGSADTARRWPDRGG